MREPKGKITERELHKSLLNLLKTKTNDNIYGYYGSVVIDRPADTVSIPIEEFNGSNDIMFVHKNGTLLVEGYDYNFDPNYKNIVKCSDGKWNETVGQKSKFEFNSFKNIKRFTKLSNIEILDNSVIESKLDKELTKGLIPPGGNKGSYLIKTSNGDYDYRWSDFTTVTIVLKNIKNIPISGVLYCITDIYSKESRYGEINNSAATLTDLNPGKYELVVYSTSDFKPEKDVYTFELKGNEQIPVEVTMIEKNHEFELEIKSDIELTNPKVHITNLHNDDSYDFIIEGVGMNISKIISLPSGIYKAEVVKEDGQNFEQINQTVIKIDYVNSVKNVVISIMSKFRVCTLDLTFNRLFRVDDGLSTYVPLFSGDSVDLLNPVNLDEVNGKEHFDVDVHVIDLFTGDTYTETTVCPHTGLKKTLKFNLKNDNPYRIRVECTDGKFIIEGALYEITADSNPPVLTSEIYEPAFVRKFDMNMVGLGPNTLKAGKLKTVNYYTIDIFLGEDLVNPYKTIYNIKPNTYLKLESGIGPYTIKPRSNSKVLTYASNKITGNATKVSPGVNPLHLTGLNTDEAFVCNFTPIIEYGFRIDPNNSDSNTCVTYIEDAEGFIPVTNINGHFDLGSWNETCLISSIRPYILFTNPNSAQTIVTKKELSVDNQTPEYNRINLNEDFTGDFMVNFEKFYYMYKETLNGEIEFRICTIRKTPQYKAPAFLGYDNQEVDSFYYGMYEGYNDGDHIRSLPNRYPTVNISMQDADSKVKSKGKRFGIEDYTRRLYVTSLITLFTKSLDSQSSIGFGNSNGSGIRPTGESANKNGMFYGDEKATKALFIENLWGNTESWLQGLIYSENGFRYLEHGPYTPVASEYYAVDATINPSDIGEVSNNVIKKCTAGTFGMLPQITNANDKYYTDLGYISNKFSIPTVGGSYKSVNGAGIWNLNVYYTWNEGNEKVSARLIYV